MKLMNAFKRDIICPKCGGRVDFDDVIDTNFYDNGTYVDTCVGSCVKCGAVCIWNDTFAFKRRSVIEVHSNDDE